MRKFIITTYLWILLSPLACIFVGAASNQAVLIANGDRFPVLINEIQSHGSLPGEMLDPVHCVMSKSTHLNALADIFDFHDAVYSVGDGFLALGEWLLSFAPFVWGFAILARVANSQHQ